jgi:beta-galactosidase
MDDADFGMRVEFVKSAAREKKVWLSELQGGRSAIGFNIYDPVDGLSQQRWIWNGIACGADTILFWCWRDEVFGRESAGFGLAGDDGLAEERLRYMQVTGKLIEQHADVIDHYWPVKPQVGVLFSPQSYYIHWAQEMNTDRARYSLLGYARALVRRSIPYQVVEEQHLEALEGLKVLFMPRAIVVDDSTGEKLLQFVKSGGTLVCESECGAFNTQGLYRYPADRFIAKATGVKEVGRRTLTQNEIDAVIGDNQFKLSATQWLTPWIGGAGESWATHTDGDLIRNIPVGNGRIIVIGTYLGDAYLSSTAEKKAEWVDGFEGLVETIVHQGGCKTEIEVLAPRPSVDSFLYVKSGLSGGKRVIFVFYQPQHGEARLRLYPGVVQTQNLVDLITGEKVVLMETEDGKECCLRRPEWNFRVLVEE